MVVVTVHGGGRSNVVGVGSNGAVEDVVVILAVTVVITVVVETVV